MGVRHRLLGHRKIGTPAHIRAAGSVTLLVGPPGVLVREVPGGIGQVVEPRQLQVDVRQLPDSITLPIFPLQASRSLRIIPEDSHLAAGVTAVSHRRNISETPGP